MVVKAEESLQWGFWKQSYLHTWMSPCSFSVLYMRVQSLGFMRIWRAHVTLMKMVTVSTVNMSPLQGKPWTSQSLCFPCFVLYSFWQPKKCWIPIHISHCHHPTPIQWIEFLLLFVPKSREGIHIPIINSKKNLGLIN